MSSGADRKAKWTKAKGRTCPGPRWRHHPVAEERGKEKENQRTTAQVIEQVEGEFRAHGFDVTLSKATINGAIKGG